MYWLRWETLLPDIKVLGTTGTAGAELERRVRVALEALDVREAHVEHVTGPRLRDYGLADHQGPGLLIDGQLAWAGSVPAQEQVVALLRKALGPGASGDNYGHA